MTPAPTVNHRVMNPKIGRQLRARPIDLDGTEGSAIRLSMGVFVVTVSMEHALRFADRIVDAVESAELEAK